MIIFRISRFFRTFSIFTTSGYCGCSESEKFVDSRKIYGNPYIFLQCWFFATIYLKQNGKICFSSHFTASCTIILKIPEIIQMSAKNDWFSDYFFSIFEKCILDYLKRIRFSHILFFARSDCAIREYLFSWINCFEMFRI